MANPNHVARLKRHSADWNKWREMNPDVVPDLNKAQLFLLNLRERDLAGADLNEANLAGADLRGANLRGANLRGADLSDADLDGTDLTGAYLSGTTGYVQPSPRDGDFPYSSNRRDQPSQESAPLETPILRDGSQS